MGDSYSIFSPRLEYISALNVTVSLYSYSPDPETVPNASSLAVATNVWALEVRNFLIALTRQVEVLLVLPI